MMTTACGLCAELQAYTALFRDIRITRSALDEVQKKRPLTEKHFQGITSFREAFLKYVQDEMFGDVFGFIPKRATTQYLAILSFLEHSSYMPLGNSAAVHFSDMLDTAKDNVCRCIRHISLLNDPTFFQSLLS